MMKHIISERSNESLKGKRSSFNYDKHLSKHSSNLKKYYRQREELAEQSKRQQDKTQSRMSV